MIMLKTKQSKFTQILSINYSVFQFVQGRKYESYALHVSRTITRKVLQQSRNILQAHCYGFS